MDSQAKIKALRAKQREIKPALSGGTEATRRLARDEIDRLGRMIDRELLRHEQRGISII